MEERLVCGVYCIHSKVDGSFGETLEVFPDDEAAGIAFAKTVAYSYVVRDEYDMYRIGEFDLRTGDIVPCPHVKIEYNEEVYSRAAAVLKKRDEEIKANESA